MNKYIASGYVFAIIVYPLFATAEESCLDQAETQRELNLCSIASHKVIQEDLDRTLERIKDVYAEDLLFLEKLDTSQESWKASFDADMEMKFPEPNKRAYGSVFPMCAHQVAGDLIQARIKFLKQWALGDMEGDVCSGSVKSERNIEKGKPVVEEET